MSGVLKSEHEWLIAAVSSVFLLNAHTTQAGSPKPNIVILPSNNLGWKDIVCYDGPVLICRQLMVGLVFAGLMVNSLLGAEPPLSA